MTQLSTVEIKWDERDRPLITVTYRDAQPVRPRPRPRKKAR